MTDFVDATNNKVGRAIFHDEEIYRQELERVFRKCWLLIGHESQIPEIGDFFLTRMGEDQVILSRGRDGKPHASGLPDWPEYDRAKRHTMILRDEKSGVVDDPSGAERALWEGLV